MIVDLALLKRLKACSAGVDWFQEKFNKECERVDHVDIVKAAMEEDRWSYAGWLLIRLMKPTDRCVFAIYVVRIIKDLLKDRVIDKNKIFASNYTIEIAKKAVANNNIEDFSEVMFMSLVLTSPSIRKDIIKHALTLINK